MTYSHQLTQRVEFAETDLAGIVHFSNYFRYMEAAEHDFFRALGYSIHGEIGGRRVGWPRVHAACQYEGPLRFEDVVEMQLLVREIKTRSIVYKCIFRKVNGDANPIVARGALVVACVSYDAETGEMRPASLPDEIRKKITVAPKELLDPAT